RYISTLLNKIDAMKKAGKDVSELEAWVNSIDPSQNLDDVRSQIIDKILSISSTSTTDVNANSNAAPKDYELAQNYPNPFNPSTSIKYSIPQNSMVSLKVYDILGKEVASLVNEQKSAGSYEVNFNANSLSAGMYIYELKAGNFTQTKKMMLIK
ncbi:MAG: T9SS type A sorting domain-containing protein, partial [Bacteroidota bacterium]|nr:T9SS type A sorting domain-containing protein [Bacteroidota bacterium]